MNQLPSHLQKKVLNYLPFWDLEKCWKTDDMFLDIFTKKEIVDKYQEENKKLQEINNSFMVEMHANEWKNNYIDYSKWCGGT